MRKRYYPYVVLIACSLLCLAVNGVGNNFGLFYNSLCDDFNVGLGAITFGSTIVSFSSGIAGTFIATPLKKKYGFKTVMVVLGGITVFFMGLLNFVNGLFFYYLMLLFFGFSSGICGTQLVSELLNNWFERSSGYFGFAVSFSGVFGIFFAPVVVDCISNYGWRTAFNIYTITLALCFLFTILFVKENPNKELYGNITKKKSVITKELLLMFIFMTGARSFATISLQSVTYAKTIGLTAAEGALLVSVANIGNLSLKLIFGYLADRIGAVKLAILNSIFCLVSGLLYMFNGFGSFFVLLIGAYFAGAGYTIINVTARSLCADYYGKENLSKYFGAFGLSTLVYGFVSPFIGYSVDFFKTYNVAIVFFEIMQIVGLIIVIYLFKNKKAS